MAAGNDRVAEYVLGLGADDKDLRAVFSAFKARLKSDVQELEAITAKVDLFKGAEARAAAAQDAFFKARDAAETYRQEIARVEASGGKVSDDLVKGLQASEKAAASAGREYNRQADSVAKLSAQLKRAGVDTSNLASEQVRLANATKAASAAQAEQEARQALGLRTLRDIAPEIQKLNAAYITLRNSGTLSAKEIALAQDQLRAKTAELRASLTGVADTTKVGDLAGFFSRAILPAIGLTGGIAGITLALKSAVQSAREFEDGIAKIATVTNASKTELAALGDGAKQVAQDVGVDVNQALQALFELIRSGVPRENALDVLRLSAEAAKASFTDVGTAVKVTNLLLDSFGADLSDLPSLFDKIVQGAHDGGATLEEFAASGSKLLAVARESGTSFDELIATLTVLVNKSGNAETSFADLGKILARLQTAEVREKLRVLGITSTDLVGIFQQMAERGTTLEQVLGADLTGAGARSAASLATLTTNARLVPEELDRITVAAGKVAQAVDTVKQSPKGIGDSFRAELKIAEDNIGRFVGTGLGLEQLGTRLLHTFNLLGTGVQRAGEAAADSNTSWLGVIKAFFTLPPAAKASADALAAVDAQAKANADSAKALEVALKNERKALGDFATQLAADIQKLQAIATQSIADINARADAQIAALDRSREAEAATAAQTIQIQLDASAKRLAIIQQSERDQTAAVNAQLAARTAAASDAEKKTNKFVTDGAEIRRQVIANELAAYQNEYNTLVSVAQAALAKVQTFETARVAIARSTQDALNAIAREGFTGLEQFVQRQKDIDAAISEGRKAALNADVETAKQYFSKAEELAKGFSTVINENGVVTVTQLQATQAKVQGLKAVQDAANESFGAQAQAARTGADGAIDAAGRVLSKINELRATYDGLAATVAQGLKARVDLDQESVDTALNTINILTAPRVIPIKVEFVGGPGGGPGVPGSPEFVGPPPPGGFNRGGPVASLVRRFAGGGSVFRTPTWSKVPGVGDSDSVPALLQAGSFVVRKSASKFYGDGLMSRLVRSFAVGGIAQNILSPGSSLLGLLLGSKAGTEGQNLGAVVGPEITTYADTLQKLQTILETARGLPTRLSNNFGTPIEQWAAAILSKWQTLPEDRRKAIDAAIKADFPSLMSSIQRGLEQHVAVNVAFDLAALALRRGGGAFGSDSVPALLTPGEWVVPKPAVQALGSRFLEAINSARVLPANLGALVRNFGAFPPVPRFATGGPVAGAAIPIWPSGAAAGATSSRPIVVNLYGAPPDFRSASTIRRFLLPGLREIERRSKSTKS